MRQLDNFSIAELQFVVDCIDSALKREDLTDDEREFLKSISPKWHDELYARRGFIQTQRNGLWLWIA